MTTHKSDCAIFHEQDHPGVCSCGAGQAKEAYDLVKRLKENAKTRASRYHDVDKEDFITWEAAAYIEELEGEKEKLSYRIAFPDVSEKVQAVVAKETERCAKLMEHFGAAEAAAIRAKGEGE